MAIVWLKRSLEDLQRLDSFLRPIDPDAANQALMSIRDHVKLVERFPEIGGRLEGKRTYRETYVRFGQSRFVIQYTIDKDRIKIVRVWHGRERRVR